MNIFFSYFKVNEKLKCTIFKKNKKMSLTPSNMMPLGTVAPNFNLYDTVSGKHLSLEEIRGEHGTLVIFMCNHCPFVVHVLDQLVAIGNDFIPQGFGMVAISSNDAKKYPQDGPEKMRQLGSLKEFPFPYLYDEDQSIAKAYDATCTPDIFLFDKLNRCVYRGQLDGSRPGNNIPITGNDIRKALNAILNEEPLDTDQLPSIGCNIKWK